MGGETETETEAEAERDREKDLHHKLNRKCCPGAVTSMQAQFPKASSSRSDGMSPLERADFSNSGGCQLLLILKSCPSGTCHSIPAFKNICPAYCSWR